MKGYKVFNKNWVCKGDNYYFQFELGKTYEHDGKIKLCESGFHFCLKLNDCFNYYDFKSTNKVAEIDFDENNVIHGEDKSVTGKITIVKELSWNEVFDMMNSGKNNTGRNNSGDYNSGYYNSGYYNSGYCNSGYWNSGDRNSGDRNSGNRNSGNRNSGNRNSGDFNSCNYSSGFFNSKESNVIMFNQQTNKKRSEIDLSIFYDMCLIEWIKSENMTADEKKEHPEHEIIGGYLKKYTYKEMWSNWYAKQDSGIDDKIKALPNFDADIFEEITGLRIK